MNRAMWLAIAALSTLPLKLLWKLHPDCTLPYDQIPAYAMFKFSEIQITMPTYYALICDRIVWLIWIYIGARFFPQFWLTFQAWFVLQALMFVEFFFNYNEAYGSFDMFGYTVEVGLFTFKLLVPPVIFIIETVIWKRR
jgi:hypothetical protein